MSYGSTYAASNATVPFTAVLRDMSGDYLDLIAAILERGRVRSPRGQKTWEVPNATFRLLNPECNLPTGIDRRWGKAIAAAEALGLVGGVSDPELMASASPTFKRFFDGGALHGAYGPRIRGQLPRVVDRLREDTDTRQAILAIWDPNYDMQGWVPKDLPCTLTIGFAIADERLEANVTMRSNDAWYGLSYDVHMFTTLQRTVASALGLQPGPYTHHAYSLHFYERDLEAYEACTYPRDHQYGAVATPSPGGPPRTFGNIETGMQRARDLLAGKPVEAPNAAEEWYAEVLAPHARQRGAEAGAGMPKDA